MSAMSTRRTPLGIDKDRFALGMGRLAGNFGRNLDGEVLRVYYRALSAVLTTEQFERAVARAIEGETFWPPVAVLVKLAGADAATRAEEAFSHVLRVLREHGGYRMLPHAVFLDAFDEATKAAIRACGGLSQFPDGFGSPAPEFVRRFVRGYLEAVGAPSAHRLHGGTADTLVREIGGGARDGVRESVRESVREGAWAQLPAGSSDADNADDGRGAR